MKQLIRLHTISLSVATAIVLTIWTFLPQFILLSEILESNLLKVLLGTLVSAGLYRLTINLIIKLAKRFLFIKKMLLGNAFLNGTWSGFYIGESKNVRFYVERYEQEIDGLVIRGLSYNENSQFHSSWIATTINIDTVEGKISYLYDCQTIDHSSTHNGLAVFNFIRNNQNSAPVKMIGFSADLHIGKRTKSMEIRISKNTNVKLEDALLKAKELYEISKDSF